MFPIFKLFVCFVKQCEPFFDGTVDIFDDGKNEFTIKQNKKTFNFVYDFYMMLYMR